MGGTISNSVSEQKHFGVHSALPCLKAWQVPFYSCVFVLYLLMSSICAYADHKKELVFVTGNWQGSSYFKNDGSFSSCTMNASYASGTELYFVINEKLNWALGIQNKTWDLEVGSKRTATIQIDQKPPVTGNAQVLSPQGFFISFGEKSKFIEDIKRGQEMVVYIDEFVAKYELKGTGKAIPDLLKCAVARINIKKDPIQTASATEQSQNIENKSSDQKKAVKEIPSTSGNRDEDRKRVSALVEQYLIEQGVRNFQIIKTEDHPDTGYKYDVMWVTPNEVLGGLRRISKKTGTNVDKIAGQIIAVDAGKCKGEFASAKKLPNERGGSLLRNVSTVCHGPESSRIVQYDLHQKKDGNFIQIFQSAILSASAPRAPSGSPFNPLRVIPESRILDSLPE